MFILQVSDNGKMLEYEYGNLSHAQQQYDIEIKATLMEYKEGKYYLVKGK